MPLDFLSNKRVQTIMRAARDVREVPTNLSFLNRTRVVDMSEEELNSYITQDISIAPIVPDGQRATVDNAFNISTEVTKAANIKHGVAMPGWLLRKIEELRSYNVQDDSGVIDRFYANAATNLLEGIRHTMELFRVSMALDTLAWNHRGVKFSAAWGTPSDLKANITAATYLSGIQAHAQLRLEKYGEQTTRVTMTSTDFRAMIATTEFANQAKLMLGPGLELTNTPTTNLEFQRGIAARLLNMEIELKDQQYTVRKLDGSITRTAFLPAGKIILGDASDDNNASACDFGNTPVTESLVAAITGDTFGGSDGLGLSANQPGPVAYIAKASHDLNPPGLVMWGVARAFPRKHRKTMESVLTVA